MIAMFVAWMIIRGPLTYVEDATTISSLSEPLLPGASTLSSSSDSKRKSRLHDLVDVDSVDLYRDEYAEDLVEMEAEDEVTKRLNGRFGLLWRLYYWLV